MRYGEIKQFLPKNHKQIYLFRIHVKLMNSSWIFTQKRNSKQKILKDKIVVSLVKPKALMLMITHQASTGCFPDINNYFLEISRMYYTLDISKGLLAIDFHNLLYFHHNDGEYRSCSSLQQSGFIRSTRAVKIIETHPNCIIHEIYQRTKTNQFNNTEGYCNLQ